MKKATFLSIAIAMLSATAFAQDKTTVKQNTKATATAKPESQPNAASQVPCCKSPKKELNNATTPKAQKAPAGKL